MEIVVVYSNGPEYTDATNDNAIVTVKSGDDL
jgi:hypothetical protein